MKLTKNEKRTLKLLLDNARISDTEIGEKLKITKQAVGKIRRKLEEQKFIRGYTADLDYGKLGITTFAISFITLSPQGTKKFNHREIEELLVKNPQVITVYKLPEGFSTYFVMLGFRDLLELDAYFKPNNCLLCHDSNNSCCVSSQRVQVFSGQSMIKTDSKELMCKAIDEYTWGSKR